MRSKERSQQRRPGTRRFQRRLAVVVAVQLLLGGVATLYPFLRPRTDRPKRADAVVVLSGDHGERIGAALKLMDAGVAPTLVLAGTLDGAIQHRLCQSQNAAYEVVCLLPDPDNTRTEARASTDLAHWRKWRTMVVVTSTYHVTRSRILFERCFDGQVLMVGARPPLDRWTAASQVRHEWAGSAHAFFLARDC